jgi:hypothetical protein
MEGGLLSPKQARKMACAALKRIFSSNKCAPANTRRLPKNEEIRGIFSLSSKELFL